MKILVLTHRTNFSGGANRSLLAVLQGLKRKGHEIEVILPSDKGLLNEALTKENIQWKSCRYYRMGAKRFGKFFGWISYIILYGKLMHHYLISKRIASMVKNRQYDVVYTNTILPYAGLFFAKKKDIPSVIHDREPLDTTQVPQIKNFEKFLYNHAEKIIVISSDLKKQWNDRGFQEKITLINNGIPKEKTVKTNQEVSEYFNILLTARISETKHHKDALSAVTKLKEQGYTNIKLYFAGSEGEKSDHLYKKELESYIKTHGLENNVMFLGEVQDMIQLRSQMHVELMCNPTEPFGRVTVEGMRSGLIIIGVNAGGTKDILINNVNGILYEEGNIDDLSEKIKMVYKDDVFRNDLSNKAFEYGNNHFTMEENVDKIEEVLLSVVK